jgi:hypothetical protein
MGDDSPAWPDPVAPPRESIEVRVARLESVLLETLHILDAFEPSYYGAKMDIRKIRSGLIEALGR